jgi:hypothetical protein
MPLQNPKVGDRCKIGGSTELDPLTPLTGRTGTIARFTVHNAQKSAVVTLDEPVNDCFGKNWEGVIVKPEFLEKEF